MKPDRIVVSSTSPDPNGGIDPRFGRARYFLVFTGPGDPVQVQENTQNLNAVQGAGIQAAETVADLGATVVITGHCGPKAFRALQAAGIQVVTGAQGRVEELVDQFRRGQLQPATSADVEGHWM